MKLYSYVVAHDHGFAPNPFWGYCTLALCTPNHMGAKAQMGDWIMGTSPKSSGNKLIYLMQISETLPFDIYYNDQRFEKKKPNIHGSWKERNGDNIYYKNQSGEWKQHATLHHKSPDMIKKDLKYPVVFIAEKFYYFGEKAISIPDAFNDLILERQGCKHNHNENIVDSFLKWIQDSFPTGISGNPTDPTTDCMNECEEISCS